MPEGILTHEQQDQAIIAEQTSVFWYSALGGFFSLETSSLVSENCKYSRAIDAKAIVFGNNILVLASDRFYC